jgi:flavin reductase (DIM6/NTAB) family NADH-FMN oxidoreductase RutF
MIINPANLINRDRYKLLISAVLPRPIAWVSSIDRDGTLNLAPFSYFTAVCNDPMTMLFCPSIPTATGVKKDTLRNIEEVPEFVINLTNQETAKAMNLTATLLPRGQSEFEWANVTPVPSETIRPPRVAEAPVAFECTLQRIVTVSERPGGGAAVFGEVQRIHLRDDLYVDGSVSLEKLKPIGRLGGNGYVRVTDTFEMERVPPPNAGDGK